MIITTKVEIKHNSHSGEVTATIGWCEPIPGVVIEGEIEGTGDTLSEALRELADELEAL